MTNLTPFEILQLLDFDRFNVSQYVAMQPELMQYRIQIAETYLNQQKATHTIAALIAKQVGIYYGFHVRSKALALPHMKRYKANTEKGSQEYAEACNFVGYIYTMDPDFKDLTLFEKALETYKSLEDNETSIENLIGMAISLRYIGLMYRRQKNLTLALENIRTAVTIQTELAKIDERVSIDAGESLHIVGIILALNEATLEEALVNFKKAQEQYAVSFKTTKTRHFLEYITLQSIGSTLNKLKRFDEAKEVLQQAYDGQIEYYGDITNADTAKTLQFWGEVFENSGEYFLAYEKYFAALLMKCELYLNPDHAVRKITQESLERVSRLIEKTAQKFYKEFNYDWNDYHSQQNATEKLAAVELFIKAAQPQLELLSPRAKFLISQISYRLACYKIHVERNAIATIDFLTLPENLFTQNELTWVKLQRAFAYQQLTAKAKKAGDQKIIFEMHAVRGSQYINEILLEYEYPVTDDQIKIYAFAKCLKALMEYELGNLNEAIVHYETAIECYRYIDCYDDQYARGLNRLGMMYMEKGDMLEAEKAFTELKTYWSKNFDDGRNPYFARFSSIYAEFLEKVEQLEKAKLPEKKAQSNNIFQMFKFTSKGTRTSPEIETDVSVKFTT